MTCTPSPFCKEENEFGRSRFLERKRRGGGGTEQARPALTAGAGRREPQARALRSGCLDPG